jgi:hypothetical protein
MFNLLQSNIIELHQRINSCQLPPVLRDSVVVARQLGIDYVWMDALCIVQDDPEDWLREASLMGSVYRNASCNFGAVAAALKADLDKPQLSDSLFQAKDLARRALIKLRIVRNDHDREYCAYST